jgi:hypothetical protein
MGMYHVPSCPDCPSSEELSVVEVDARIHKVLDLGVNLNPGVGPVPLQRGVTSARVSMPGSISVAFVILSFHCTSILRGVFGAAVVSQGMLTHPRMLQTRRRGAPLMRKSGPRERERSACCQSGSKEAGGGEPP